MERKTKFIEADFKEFVDPKNSMIEAFGIGCSLCGLQEIAWVSENAPLTVGQIAQDIFDKQGDVSDEELEKMLEPIVDAWQQVDDHNSSIGAPTFLCDSCYYQLINDEIQISEFDEEIED